MYTLPARDSSTPPTLRRRQEINEDLAGSLGHCAETLHEDSGSGFAVQEPVQILKYDRSLEPYVTFDKDLKPIDLDGRETACDSTRQIKRNASRQEVGGEVGPTGRIALWGGFGAWIPSLYGRGNGYSTIACNPISTDAIYPIYHTLLSGALSTPAGGRSIA
ncbi:hypothetical protein ALC62_08234 [Cyphomyrmex costatus]|uniref:Uncharacterized protein n=1 Tax=Cyphomyrmex costatus TaxID=456900 RepID=A0A195CJW8_9HYME|nr:hypothetical protein ALC62_08234 [Cyphomyrmex costatus]